MECFSQSTWNISISSWQDNHGGGQFSKLIGHFGKKKSAQGYQLLALVCYSAVSKGN